MMPLLEASGIALAGRLQPTDLQLDRGSMLALIGTNGSGKTSLLRALAGVELDRGEVRIAGEDVRSAPAARRPNLLSFLPASRDLVWPIRARDVVKLGTGSNATVDTDALLAEFELDTLAERPVNQLSTGERSRVLLARALAARPQMLLLDEPLSNLDPYWVLRVLEIVRGGVDSGASALVSLHDIDKAPSFDRVLLMDGGKIIADLAPEQMLDSPSLSEAFDVERGPAGWRIRRREDRQSSP